MRFGKSRPRSARNAAKAENNSPATAMLPPRGVMIAKSEVEKVLPKTAKHAPARMHDQDNMHQRRAALKSFLPRAI